MSSLSGEFIENIEYMGNYASEIVGKITECMDNEEEDELVTYDLWDDYKLNSSVDEALNFFIGCDIVDEYCEKYWDKEDANLTISKVFKTDSIIEYADDDLRNEVIKSLETLGISYEDTFSTALICFGTAYEKCKLLIDLMINHGDEDDKRLAELYLSGADDCIDENLCFKELELGKTMLFAAEAYGRWYKNN